jgi:16S rRNA processing protein RimM
VDKAESIEVVVGRIGKPHGIRGEVTVEVRTDEPDRRFAVGTTVRAERPSGAAAAWTELTIAAVRWHRSTLLVTFEELSDRTTAESARGLLLHAAVSADESPEDPEEFYDHQLVGLAVSTTDGEPVGEVADVVHGTAQDLLAVRTPDGREVLVPFVTALVPVVDVPGRRVEVADRPGLLAPLPDDEA